MEPGVIEARRLERQLVVLVVVLADEDLCAVRRLEVEGAGGLVVVLLLGLLAQVAGGDELVVDLGDLREIRGGEQRRLDALEVGDICLALAALDLQQFLCTLELVVLLVAGLHVLDERQALVERDCDGFARLTVDVRHGHARVLAVLELVLVRHEVVAAHLEFLRVLRRRDLLVELRELVLGTVLLILDELAEAVLVGQHVGAEQVVGLLEHGADRREGERGGLWQVVEREGGHGDHLLVLAEQEHGLRAVLAAVRRRLANLLEGAFDGLEVGLVERFDADGGREPCREADFLRRDGAEAHAGG